MLLQEGSKTGAQGGAADRHPRRGQGLRRSERLGKSGHQVGQWVREPDAGPGKRASTAADRQVMARSEARARTLDSVRRVSFPTGASELRMSTDSPLNVTHLMVPRAAETGKETNSLRACAEIGTLFSREMPCTFPAERSRSLYPRARRRLRPLEGADRLRSGAPSGYPVLSQQLPGLKGRG